MLALPVPLILAGVAGYHFAGKILKPLEAMARRTEQITAERLHSGISVENPNDEFGHMAAVLNGFLERLEQSFSQLQRFTSDVSHELRTPLSSIRSVGEGGLQRTHTGEEFRDIIGSMLEEVARPTSTIDTLLTIAHADSGAVQLHRTVSPIMDLVEESTNVVGVLAEDKGQSLSATGESSICVAADRGFLRMAVINLLDNAVKYSPSGSAIRVVVERCTLAGAQSAFGSPSRMKARVFPPKRPRASLIVSIGSMRGVPAKRAVPALDLRSLSGQWKPMVARSQSLRHQEWARHSPFTFPPSNPRLVHESVPESGWYSMPWYSSAIRPIPRAP